MKKRNKTCSGALSDPEQLEQWLSFCTKRTKVKRNTLIIMELNSNQLFVFPVHFLN